MSSGTFDATPSGGRGGRAFKPGRGWAFGAALAVVLIAAAVVVVLLTTGGSKNVDNSFGQLPPWLPKAAASAKPQYEVATAAKPVLSEEQGYTVHAELPSGTANITAEGPGIPGYVTRYADNGLWPAGKQVPSVFYVKLAAVKGTIPLSPDSFSVQDAAYQHVAASFTLKGGGKAPAVVHTGQSVTLAVHTRTLEGQGAIAWSPTGKDAMIAWIYQLELD